MTKPRFLEKKQGVLFGIGSLLGWQKASNNFLFSCFFADKGNTRLNTIADKPYKFSTCVLSCVSHPETCILKRHILSKLTD